MNQVLKNQVTSLAEQLFDKVVAYRQHIHQNPELSYQEYETMEYISEQLTKIGIPHEKGVADTGIIAMIRGSHHTRNQSCVALRADIDALPITETNDLPFRSKNEGVMHLSLIHI